MVTVALYTAGHAAVGFPLLLGGAVWRLATLRPPLWQRTPLDLPLAAFGVILVLSTAASPYRSIAVTATAITVASGAVFFGSFAWLVHRNPSARPALLRVWALGGPPAAVVGMIAGRWAPYRAHFPKMPMGSSAFGTTLLIGSLIALGLAYRAQGRGRLLWFGCAVVTLVALLDTISRSPLAGWLAGAVYLTWRELRPHPRRLAVTLASGLAILALAAVIIPHEAGRIRQAPAHFMQDRLQIWEISAGMVGAHPFLGTGPGTFQTVFPEQKLASGERKWSAHNLWLNYTVETGLLGLLSILWVLAVAGREWVRSGRQAARAIGPLSGDPLWPAITAVVIGVLVDQCGDNTLLSVSTVSGFWLLLAFLVVPLPSPAHRRESEDGVPVGGGGARVVPLEVVVAAGTRSKEGSW
jgi:O-antigen ligase